MGKNTIERILLFGTLIQNILPYTWTIFLSFFYVYKRSINLKVSYPTLYFSTALMMMTTFFARNIKSSVHNILGLKRTIQLTGLLYLLNFFSFYRFPSWTFFYLNSIWLGMLNGILTSTVLTYLRDKQELSKPTVDFYASIAQYISFIFWGLISMLIFNIDNRPLMHPKLENYSNDKNKEYFRTLMDIFGITAVMIIEGCTAFLEDPIKYNPAFQEWLHAKLNEEREAVDNIELNNLATRKRVIGQMDDQSISNVHNNRMDNRISGNTLFTTKMEVEDLIINDKIGINTKNRYSKTDKMSCEDEPPLSVSFLNPHKDNSEHLENYDMIAQNTYNGQNFFLIFILNCLRLVSNNFISFSACIIGLNVYDNTYAVFFVIFIGTGFKLLGNLTADYIPRIINVHKIYLLNIVLNIFVSLIALNMEGRFKFFSTLICIQKLVEGIIYSLQGITGNYLYEFDKREIASSLFELESVSSVVIGALMAFVFVDQLNFNFLFKIFVSLDIIVLILFFYLVSTKF